MTTVARAVLEMIGGVVFVLAFAGFVVTLGYAIGG